MSLSRRSLIWGLVAAPAVISTPGLLMPVKPLPWVMLPKALPFERFYIDILERIYGDVLDPTWFPPTNRELYNVYIGKRIGC